MPNAVIDLAQRMLALGQARPVDGRFRCQTGGGEKLVARRLELTARLEILPAAGSGGTRITSRRDGSRLLRCGRALLDGWKAHDSDP